MNYPPFVVGVKVCIDYMLITIRNFYQIYSKMLVPVYYYIFVYSYIQLKDCARDQNVSSVFLNRNQAKRSA